MTRRRFSRDHEIAIHAIINSYDTSISCYWIWFYRLSRTNYCKQMYRYNMCKKHVISY